MEKVLPLRDYQRNAIVEIIEQKNVGVWMQCGLGKTRCVLESWEMLGRPKMLVVAPKLTCETVWPEEAVKWLGEVTVVVIAGTEKKRRELMEKDAEMYVVSRDNLYWYMTNGGVKRNYEMIVLDEASSFKNPKSKRFKAAKEFCKFADRVVELTGTPASNGYIDLWSQVWLLDKGERLGNYITHYKQKYFRGPIVNGFMIYKYPLHGAIDEINRKIKDITFAIKAEDNLNLPKRIDNKILIKMDENTKQIYKKMKKDYVITDKIFASSAGVLCGKLCQLSNGFIYDDEKNPVEFSNHKLEYMQEVIDTIQENILIVAIFQRDMDALEKMGGIKLDTADKIKEWNKGNIKVGLIQPASSTAMGTNLQSGGSTVFWFSLCWSLEFFVQTNGRLYRQGQENTVTINCLVTEGTVEERLYDCLLNKNLTQDKLLNFCKLEMEG